MARTELRVGGMLCDQCERAAREALEALEGVIRVDIGAEGTVMVESSSEDPAVPRFIEALEQEGFDAAVA